LIVENLEKVRLSSELKWIIESVVKRLGASHSSIEWIIESVVKRLGASHSSIAYE